MESSCFPPIAALTLKDAPAAKSSKCKVTSTSVTAKNSLNNSSCRMRNSNSSGMIAAVTTPPDLKTEIETYAKLDILQDLDLYYIRQIAHKFKELDLEQKIELEIKMREGSAKLLAASRQPAQSLEAARALLTSNERMGAYMAELQRRRKEPTTRILGSRGRLSLSEVRLPLMWRGPDHFKNKGDYRRFAVFCLARVGTEILDTALVCPVDRSMTDVTFPDTLVFNHVNCDFELRLEVYSHLLAEDLSMASTPRKLQRTLHSSISRTVGKKLAASLRDELHARLGPQFQLVASAKMSLGDIDEGNRTHDLQMHTLSNRSQELPLFGHFCCRLAAQPDCLNKVSLSGELRFKEGPKTSWSTMYAILKGFDLTLWTSRDQRDEHPKTLCLNKESRVSASDSGTQLILSRASTDATTPQLLWFLKLASEEEKHQWLRLLNNTLHDFTRWGRAAEKAMHISSPGPSRHSFHLTSHRQGSLYDQTPLIENTSMGPPTALHGGHLQVQDLPISTLTPAGSLSSCTSSSASSSPPMSFRERTRSGTGLRATLRGHWPFK